MTSSVTSETELEAMLCRAGKILDFFIVGRREALPSSEDPSKRKKELWRWLVAEFGEVGISNHSYPSLNRVQMLLKEMPLGVRLVPPHRHLSGWLERILRFSQRKIFKFHNLELYLTGYGIRIFDCGIRSFSFVERLWYRS